MTYAAQTRARPTPDTLIVRGGRPLQGSVVVSGFKHSLVTAVAAACLGRAPVRIRDCPAIAGMLDRPCRPHTSPSRLAGQLEAQILALRLAERRGPAWIAAQLGLHASTVGRALRRAQRRAGGPTGPDRAIIRTAPPGSSTRPS